MSVISLAYMAALPLLSKRYDAKWLYRICMVIAIGWMFPFRPSIDLPSLPIHIPDTPLLPLQSVEPMIDITAPTILAAGDVVEGSATIPIWWVLAVIWITGFSVVVIIHAYQHRRLMKVVSRWSEPVTDLTILGILNHLKSALKIETQVELKVCPGITSPMLIGFWHPTILLPPAPIAEDELQLILKHELIHLKQHDLWYKALILIITALHWFNPVVYLMGKATAAQCEISCDALVLQGADFQQRKRYGEAIIGVVRNSSKLRTALTTNLYGGKNGMKKRIFSIMDTTKKKAGITILCVVLTAIIGTGAVFAANSSINDQASNVVNEDKQERKPIIGPTKTKQVINVDVKSLEIGEFVAVEGPFTLKEGDIIQYDIKAEGSGHLNVELRKTADPNDDKGYLGHSGLTGNYIRDVNSFRVKQKWAGTYYLWIGNFDGKTLDKNNDNGVLNKIEGTMTILQPEKGSN